MSNKDLKNRTARYTTFKNSLDKAFTELSKEMRIPKTRLLDEALELLLTKYNKEW